MKEHLRALVVQVYEDEHNLTVGNSTTAVKSLPEYSQRAIRSSRGHYEEAQQAKRASVSFSHSHPEKQGQMCCTGTNPPSNTTPALEPQTLSLRTYVCGSEIVDFGTLAFRKQGTNLNQPFIVKK